LLQEFQSGVYTRCQIAEWADEQRLAWFEATQEDGKLLDDETIRPEFSDSNMVLVPVRLRRQRAPWYRDFDDLGRGCGEAY
jgi:hypothetical protein